VHHRDEVFFGVEFFFFYGDFFFGDEFFSFCVSSGYVFFLYV
jgi:hypothetical protein